MLTVCLPSPETDNARNNFDFGRAHAFSDLEIAPLNISAGSVLSGKTGSLHFYLNTGNTFCFLNKGDAKVKEVAPHCVMQFSYFSEDVSIEGNACLLKFTIPDDGSKSIYQLHHQEPDLLLASISSKLLNELS